jgi:hypothetical protein
MLAKTFGSLLILMCALVLPMIAQTPAPASAANQTMGTNPAAEHHHHHMAAPGGGRAYGEATRLAALLADTQGKAMLSADAWKKIANEANGLANKLYGAARGKNRAAAKDLRTHVREMRAAAMKGDADGAKSHGGMALPYVYQIIDASK